MKLNILSRLRKKSDDLVFSPNVVAQLPERTAEDGITMRDVER